MSSDQCLPSWGRVGRRGGAKPVGHAGSNASHSHGLVPPGLRGARPHLRHQRVSDSKPPVSTSVGAVGAKGHHRVSVNDIQLVQNLVERCLQAWRGAALAHITTLLIEYRTVKCARARAEWLCVLSCCAQMYMHQKDAMALLQQQANIEPGLAALVWQKLEEQNADFFKCAYSSGQGCVRTVLPCGAGFQVEHCVRGRLYHTRLRLKDQILHFNYLLDQHSMQARPRQSFRGILPAHKKC